MLKKIAVISVIILLALAGVISLAMYLTNVETENRARADVNNNPTKHMVTNMTNSSVTVTWYTENKTVGKVKLVDSGKIFYDDRDSVLSTEGTKRNTHSVTLSGIKSEKQEYLILVNDIEYKNVNSNYQVTLPKVPSSLSSPKPIYGDVKLRGSSASNILVKLVSTSKDLLPLSNITTSNGSYTFDLSNLIDESGNQIVLSSGDDIRLEVMGEDGNSGLVRINVE